MSVYARYKKDPEGFRKLVELLETTSSAKREKMVEVGLAEDPHYTEKALRYCLDFQDILDMPDQELVEVLAKALPRMAGMAISHLDNETQQRFLRCAPPKKAAEFRDAMEVKVSLREVGGAQLKMISYAREAEKAGFVRTKKIPSHLD